jgi:glycosyltransferase involved in cell wall biosynthesis
MASRSIPGGQLELGPERMAIASAMEPLLLSTISQYAVQIYQLVPSATRIQSIIGHAQMDPELLRTINRYTVLYTVWERQSVSEKIIEPLRRAGQVWVACHDNAQMLERCGLDADKIRVVPMPFFEDDPLLALDGRKRTAGVPRFYHIGKWEPRKQQHRILGAFLMAFSPGEAKLWLKTSAYAPKLGYYARSPEESVHRWVKDPRVQQNGWDIERVNRDVYVMKKQLPEKQIRALHKLGDVYVTLSQGEGFDMPAFDSKLAGNLMVYTPSGGPQDFCGDSDVLVPKTADVPCHPFYRWEEEATYLDYQIEDAVEAMRQAASLVREGKRVRGTSLADYEAVHVGAEMLAHLEMLLDGPLTA